MSRPRIAPEVKAAVVHLLEAEQAWSRAYDAWSHAPPQRRHRLEDDLTRAESRMDEAQRAAIDAQPSVHESGQGPDSQ